VGLQRGTIEELLGRNSIGSGLENREYGRGVPLRWPRDTLYPQKLALTSPTNGGRLVGVVRLRSKATEFFMGYLTLLSAALTVQGVPGGKFNILGGLSSSMGHSKQQSVYVHVSYSERFPR
jgi:hypothetical protein